MLCGTGSFSHVDDDDDGGGSWASTSRRPKPFKLRLKLKKKKSFLLLGRSGAKNANPFSGNGLDKFGKLLAELEAEKKRVLLDRGSDDDTVRFRYRRRSNTEEEEWVPIVIKRPQTPAPLAKKKKKRKNKEKKADVEVEERLQEEVHEETTQLVARKLNSTSRSVPCWAVVVVVVVVVLMCMVFGRAFAGSWAAILWYMLPMIMNKKKSRSSGCNLKRKEEEHGS